MLKSPRQWQKSSEQRPESSGSPAMRWDADQDRRRNDVRRSARNPKPQGQTPFFEPIRTDCAMTCGIQLGTANRKVRLSFSPLRNQQNTARPPWLGGRPPWLGDPVGSAAEKTRRRDYSALATISGTLLSPWHARRCLASVTRDIFPCLHLPCPRPSFPSPAKHPAGFRMSGVLAA